MIRETDAKSAVRTFQHEVDITGWPIALELPTLSRGVNEQGNPVGQNMVDLSGRIAS